MLELIELPTIYRKVIQRSRFICEEISFEYEVQPKHRKHQSVFKLSHLFHLKSVVAFATVPFRVIWKRKRNQDEMKQKCGEKSVLNAVNSSSRKGTEKEQQKKTPKTATNTKNLWQNLHKCSFHSLVGRRPALLHTIMTYIHKTSDIPTSLISTVPILSSGRLRWQHEHSICRSFFGHLNTFNDCIFFFIKSVVSVWFFISFWMKHMHDICNHIQMHKRIVLF